ncbi:MAG: secondary thiamine-phosphate synthase enzyme YjbQ [Melioribacteraceae bacterium]|nr:MAG: secondary thiamine-phosphate synthase enzyme YjbQ [Melioribacteraceae bacterium]
MWIQKEFGLKPRRRGFHLITDEILKNCEEIHKVKVGLLHIFIQHTSASLTLNENASSDVRSDMEKHFNNIVPENAPYYQHTFEGADDMPAHIKSSILGASLTIPIKNGSLNMGTWQGVYLCEHRNNGGARRLIITINGESNE